MSTREALEVLFLTRDTSWNRWKQFGAVSPTNNHGALLKHLPLRAERIGAPYVNLQVGNLDKEGNGE